MDRRQTSTTIRTSSQPDSKHVVAATRELMLELLASGDAIFGDVVRDAEGILEVQPWALSPSEAVARIGAEWTELGRLCALGEVGRLELTETGRENARRAR